jgi:16S rRNA (guanine527-N7)-methyltransferase
VNNLPSHRMRLPMNLNEIANLLRPFLGSDSLSNDQLSRVAIYLDLLLKWNAKINLTAIRTPEEIATRHFGESLFAARYLLPKENRPASAMDVGSGAGFPGLPMKICCPNLALTLIESNGKKATFLREVSRALELDGVEVLSRRAEDIKTQTDLVTQRAVERFVSILPVAERLMRPGGALALLIGSSQEEVAKRQLPNLRWQPAVPVPESQSRVLLVGSKDNS